MHRWTHVRVRYSHALQDRIVIHHNMRVLHIANDFAGSKVHCNLAKALDREGIEQVVYCPVRNKKLLGGNQFEGDHTEFVYSNCIKPWYKYVYYYKQWKLYRDLKNHVDLLNVDYIHAHTLFSDGGLAYKAHKDFGVKYAVAIRNTDVNVYMQLMKHTYSNGRKVLLNAEKIFFISLGLKKLFEDSDFCKPIYDRIKNKFIVQPNGIEDYWHEHINHINHSGHDVLYIGEFTPNKNVGRVIEAVKKVRNISEFNDCKLIVIGGGRDRNGEIEELIRENSSFVEYLGKIYDKEKLSLIMKRCSVFAMPSIKETFGLVYLEALSQNLPVIYTKNQGIDGLFDDSIGIAVNPHSVDEISDAIVNILNQPQSYNNLKINYIEIT